MFHLCRDTRDVEQQRPKRILSRPSAMGGSLQQVTLREEANHGRGSGANVRYRTDYLLCRRYREFGDATPHNPMNDAKIQPTGGRMNSQSGGPAFPRPETVNTSRGGDAGMSLRDYFAAAALQSLCSGGADEVTQETGKSAPGLAQAAYLIADEMIRARSA
jgi:hypothetical protein